MRKFLVLMVVVLVAASFIFGGCSASPAPSSAPSSAATNTTAKPPVTTTASATTTPVQTSAAAGAPAVELKFSHQNPPQGWTTVQFLNPWAKQVETVTNGKVKILMYPAQSLAATADMYDATINGLAQMTWIPTAPYEGRFPMSVALSLPFIALPSGTIDGKKVGPAAVNSRILQELYETTPEVQKEWAQTKLLFLHTSDPFFLASKKPVKSVADIKGLKIAVLGSGPALDMFKKLGASPVFMAAPAVFENGQKGVIDAVTTNWASMGTYRFNEVFPYATDMTSYVSIFAVAMNLDAWNKLSPDVQKQIMSVSGQTGSAFAANTAFGEDAKNDILNKIKAAGSKLDIVSLDAGEFDKMKTAAGKPLWDEWVTAMKAKNLPADKVLDTILKLTDKYK